MALKNNKSLGQHWLYNREILDTIAKIASEGAAAACPSDDSSQAALAKSSCSAEHIATAPSLVVEIGPGLGTLTSSLLRRFDKVIAVEFDQRLAENLPKSFPGKNLEVVNADFLKFDLGSIKEPYVVAGNIPYYITSPIIEKLITAENMPERIVLLIQKEVAERILSEKESMLSLAVKNRANVKAGPVVLRDEFTPPPKVDSQVIILEPHEPIVSDAVLKIVQLGFSAPRKKLLHNLLPLKSRDELEKIFETIGVSVEYRPADLLLKHYRRLIENML